MIERNLAEWPIAEPQAERNEAQPQEPQEWNQEELKFLNERREIESAEQRLLNLLPVINLKRLVF